MGKITLTLDDVLEERFREEIFKRLGMKKGNIQAAIEEAIETWIKAKKPS
jgi:hypothetical protein